MGKTGGYGTKIDGNRLVQNIIMLKWLKLGKTG